MKPVHRKKSRDYILVIEDNRDDIEIISKTLQEAGLDQALHVCRDGDTALEFLREINSSKHAAEGNAHFPSIILLDLNLPGTDGKEVLEQIKNSYAKEIPIIILTTSMNRRDIDYCYARGANSYVVKPDSYSGYVDCFRALKQWWYEQIKLPAH